MNQLGGWCTRWLGSRPERVLFESGHLARVIGLELGEGRQVVLKLRSPAARIRACVDVQRHLWSRGFECPEPLVGPHPLGELAATAESLVSGGTQLEHAEDSAALFASALARLIRLAPPVGAVGSLSPTPPWVGWDHDQPGTWPSADDTDTDLNTLAAPAWLDALGARVRGRRQRDGEARVIGHADWESQNLRWLDRNLRVVHDWDSLAVLSEAAIAGAAAAVYSATGASLTEPAPDQTRAFLAVYEEARGRVWTASELQVCWAAGLWVRAYNARKASIHAPGGRRAAPGGRG